MSNVIESIERAQLRTDIPQFKAGDTVRVHFQVIEGQRRRVQVFEGIVIKRQGAGVRETFTVRKQSFGVGVERTFPLHSPKIEQIEVMAIGDVNRAKLYYLRGSVGKKARVREKQQQRPGGVVEVETPLTAVEPDELDRARPRGTSRSRSRPASRGRGRRRRRARARQGRGVRPFPQKVAPAEAGAILGACLRAAASASFASTDGSAHASSRAPTRPAVARWPGPLVVAGVLLDYECLRDHRVRPLALLNDSKQLSQEERQELFRAVVGCATKIAVRMYSRARDRPQRAAPLEPRRHALVPRRARAAGRGRASSTASASARARRRTARSSTATRRALRSRPPRSSRRSCATGRCAGMDAVFPHYGFSSHVGYITPNHSAAVRARGPSHIHRRSFQALCYADRAETGVGAAS